MAFGISGFGATQIAVAPQPFQALSLGGAQPVPPAPPYGNPNTNLVPVTRTGNPAFPANLTLAAHPVFDAILRLQGSTVLQFGHPPFQTAIPNTTAGIASTNPVVGLQIQGQAPGAIPTIGNPPQGPVSFGLTKAPANLTSGLYALQQTIANLPAPPSGPSAPAAPPGQPSSGQAPSGQPASTPAPPTPGSTFAPTPGSTSGIIPAAAPAAAVGKIVSTVQTLAIGAVYGGPVFSFSA